MSRTGRIAITGLGATTPFGRGVKVLEDGVFAGRSAASPITLFDPADLPVNFACEVPGVPGAGPFERAFRFAVESSCEAWADAGAPSTLEPERIGVCSAIGHPGAEAVWFADEIEHALAVEGLPDADARFENFQLGELLEAHGGTPALRFWQRPATMVGEIARCCGAEGPTALISTSCPGSLQALITAADVVRDGEADLMIAGGTDSMINATGMMGFARLQALSTNVAEPTTASRPFDRTRDGFVMGEGAGAIVLEDWDHALRRGARIHAEWLGAGLACDAYRISDEHPEGRGAVAAVREALTAAGVRPDQIGYVNAHGSSTPMNDRIETSVLRQTLGDRAYRIPVSSVKSMIGHLIHASAVVEIIVTVLSMEAGIVPPTAHHRVSDPRCDLDYVPNEARAHRFDIALKNSFGFGGINGAVVLKAVR